MADALVDWPSAPLTDRLVKRSLQALQPPPRVSSSAPESYTKLIQWSTYDSIDHEATHEHSDSVLSSSFVIRKALIRKHYLARCIHNYLVKHPESGLKHCIPRTWDLEISFADELDEKWSDDLWDLGQELDASGKWWILKPGMADRGMGIRLFNSKSMLEAIFQEFEDEEDEEEDDENDAKSSRDTTAIVTSQLRHFVIQEYVSNPLLLDPHQVPLEDSTLPPKVDDLKGHKFHLRAYCFASGALEVYLYTRILALFSSVPYEIPRSDKEDSATGVDLMPHLTNTSLQINRGEEGVRLLSELAGCRILSQQSDQPLSTLTAEDIEEIISQMSTALAETFKSALQMPIHFQPLPNAFELYGIDFLVSHNTNPSLTSSESRLQVQLLEINSEPAIELTGPRLTWILEDLFVAMGKICVQPFLDRPSGADSKQLSEAEVEDGGLWLGEDKLAVRKVFDFEVRGSGGW